MTTSPQLHLDPEGHLLRLEDWSPEAAQWLATENGITLTQAHWEIIHTLRDFYQRYDLVPAMRPLTKAIKAQHGPDKARSIYLMQLFGESPARMAAKIAGLPKPDNCL